MGTNESSTLVADYTYISNNTMTASKTNASAYQN